MQDVVGLVAGSGFASGLSLYATVFLLGVYGRWLEPAALPEVLTSTPVLVIAGVLALIEFVADKVPWLDSVWDTVHTFIRPIGAAVLATVLVDGDAQAFGDVAAGGLAGVLALISHSAKASTRVAVNTSPEPFSNGVVSLIEDGIVAVVVYIAIEHPVTAAIVVGVLVVLSILLIVGLWKLVKRVRHGLRGRSFSARREMSRR